MIHPPRSSYSLLLCVASICLVLSGCLGQQESIPADEIPGDAPLICAVGAGGSVPDKLSATGLFADLATLTPVNGFHEYEVIAPLWADHGHKSRWMWLPAGAQITFSADGPWQFPAGTCLVKQFDLDLSPSSANKNTVHVETRILVKGTTAWFGYTYEWSDDQTDATLLPADGGTKVLNVADPTAPSGVRQQTWTYPGRTDCLKCHNDSTGGAIAIRTDDLNREHTYKDGKTENQLTHWNDQGLFSVDIGSPAQYAALTDPSDATKPASARARSYLAVNCAHCHQPGGTSAQDMDLRFTTPIDQMGLINQQPSRGTLGVEGAMRVVPGHKELSVLWLRMMVTDDNRMPAIGSAIPDPVGTEVVGLWIDEMGANP